LLRCLAQLRCLARLRQLAARVLQRHLAQAALELGDGHF